MYFLCKRPNQTYKVSRLFSVPLMLQTIDKVGFLRRLLMYPHLHIFIDCNRIKLRGILSECEIIFVDMSYYSVKTGQSALVTYTFPSYDRKSHGGPKLEKLGVF